jgi:hypothetical protein
MNSLRRYIFLGIAVVLTVFVLKARIPSRLDPIIRLTLLQNADPIKSLAQKRKISDKRKLEIDRINFPHGDTFVHPLIGPLGVSHNFFLEFDTIIEVQIDGIYRFFVTSDDGFRLVIDGKTVSEFLKDREFSTTQAERFLRVGKYRLRLSYFQAGGPLGLQAEYTKKGSTQSYLIGESSEWLSFSLPN